ncbi:hypothetical protein conserved [Leishmania donovani]|uniref:Hypothetical_protein_conserved n=1 Tax=Leishmania donovani TaxID=5661 RepID=A0A3S7WWW7_LEIDO|nr:hypothetical protein, unknown function [Leishmania donovani]AYU78660.1 hypothetical protein LdCL_210025200 [Leishmania donovani]TPP49410.1 hypothetical protein CGC21_34590 [Leishmania donovani]TPP54605.1 hypothetical protein CGC20_21990 [Leishmania donovani]CAJ1988665.1 hypothetical protein conserved [Leishmania donovani]CBZ34007.1 hypothetical protein, unknown function [Leishmania donovani]
MKIFSTLGRPGTLATTKPKKGEVVLASPEATVSKYKGAIKQHKKALKELHACTERFTRALAAVAASLQFLTSDTHIPVMVQSSGALASGIEEVQDGVLLQDLMEELDYSLSTRFKQIAEDQRELKESRERKSKAEKTLMLLRSQCDKLQLKKDVDAKMQALYLTKTQKRDEHEVECTRLRAEFEDAFHDFTTRFGILVYEDMKGLMEHLHRVLSALSYQVRKCKDNILAHPITPKPIAEMS